MYTEIANKLVNRKEDPVASSWYKRFNSPAYRPRKEHSNSNSISSKVM